MSDLVQHLKAALLSLAPSDGTSIGNTALRLEAEARLQAEGLTVWPHKPPRYWNRPQPRQHDQPLSRQHSRPRSEQPTKLLRSSPTVTRISARTPRR